MADNRKPLFGFFSGKLGLTYGRIVHGVNIVSALPETKGFTPTSKQADNMDRFGALGHLGSAFTKVLNIGFKNARKQFGPLVSGFDAFMKCSANAVVCIGGDVSIDYSSLVIAKGNLPNVFWGTPDASQPQTVKIPFQSNADYYTADSLDEVYAVMLCERLNETLVVRVHRYDGVAQFADIRSSWVGLKCHIYGFTVGAGRMNKGKTSDSSYIGTVEIN